MCHQTQVATIKRYLEENGIPSQRNNLVLDAMEKTNVKIVHAGTV